MLSAIGATERNLRLVMIVNGLVVGVTGALAGAPLGFAAWFAYVPTLQQATGHVVDAANLPWWAFGIGVAFAIATSVLASRRPAKTMARVPVVAALSGRPAPPKPVHRSALPGVIVFAAGVACLASTGATLYQVGSLEQLGFTGSVYLATPQLLATYGIKAGQIAPGTDVLTMRPGLASLPHMELTWGNYGYQSSPGGLVQKASTLPACTLSNDCLANPTMQTVSSLPGGTSAPNTLKVGADLENPPRNSPVWTVPPNWLSSRKADHIAALAANGPVIHISNLWDFRQIVGCFLP